MAQVNSDRTKCGSCNWFAKEDKDYGGCKMDIVKVAIVGGSSVGALTILFIAVCFGVALRRRQRQRYSPVAVSS